MTRQDLEEKSEHGSDLGQDSVKVALSRPVPGLDKCRQQRFVLVILGLSLLCLEVFAEDCSSAGHIVLVGWV